MITKDPRILSWITGYVIPFTSLPVQVHIPKNNNFNTEETFEIDECIEDLLCKGAISAYCQPCIGQYFSKYLLCQNQMGK